MLHYNLLGVFFLKINLLFFLWEALSSLQGVPRSLPPGLGHNQVQTCLAETGLQHQNQWNYTDQQLLWLANVLDGPEYEPHLLCLYTCGQEGKEGYMKRVTNVTHYKQINCVCIRWREEWQVGSESWVLKGYIYIKSSHTASHMHLSLSYTVVPVITHWQQWGGHRRVNVPSSTYRYSTNLVDWAWLAFMKKNQNLTHFILKLYSAPSCIENSSSWNVFNTFDTVLQLQYFQSTWVTVKPQKAIVSPFPFFKIHRSVCP